MDAHENRINCVAFSHDAEILLTVGDDSVRTMLIWENFHPNPAGLEHGALMSKLPKVYTADKAQYSVPTGQVAIAVHLTQWKGTSGGCIRNFARCVLWIVTKPIFAEENKYNLRYSF